MHTARDVMSTPITVPVTASVEDTIRSLLAGQISGAPVVDQQGRLMGIVSEFQLLEAVYTPEVMSQPVVRFMTREVLTVPEDATLAEVASIMLLHRIRLVPVVCDEQLVGVVTRRDLLQHTIDTGAPSHALSAVGAGESARH